jgi:putative nucleotidyltransferase with HDIG domain
MSFRPAERRTLSLAALAAFVVLTTAVLTAIIFPEYGAGLDLSEGDLAPRTVLASRNFTYESEALTDQRRDEAELAVQDLVEYDPSVQALQASRLDASLAEITNIRRRKSLPESERRALLAELEGAVLSPQARSDIVSFTDGQWEDVQLEVSQILEESLAQPLAANDVGVLVASLPQQIDPSFNGAQARVVEEMLSNLLAPTLVVDEEASAEARQEARENVIPVIVAYSEGQVVVAEGQRIDAATLETLRESDAIGGGFEVADFLAVATLSLLAATALGLYLATSPLSGVEDWRGLTLVGLVVAITVTAAKFAAPLVLPDTDRQYLLYALPVAAAPMLLASLFSLGLGVVVTPIVALLASFAAVYAPEFTGSSITKPLEGVEMAMAFMFGSLAGVVMVHRAERLSRYAVAGIVVFAMTWLVLVVFWLLDVERAAEEVAWITLAAGVNGLLSPVLALAAFLALAMLLGVTTRLQLMELAQVSHPLLRQLQEQAPGTFHHSMVVGDLAERAAYEVGGDPLLARVGSYYHDIGKTVRPAYFIENQFQDGGNPHDSVEPLESARIIAGHTREGLELARRYRLPPAVRDFIPQHHGTRLVTYFYRKAAQADPAVSPSAFQYAGPKPQTKETAIVMLADSCEAVVRSASDRSQERIDQLVDEVIGERLAEGQLDECALTMRDLRKIAASFKTTLAAVYHQRIEYPEPTEIERRRLRSDAPALAPLVSVPMDGNNPPGS